MILKFNYSYVKPATAKVVCASSFNNYIRNLVLD